MTEDRPLYGNPICACSFRSQGHEPGECEDFAVVDVWMWQPEGGWHYVSLCGPCIGRCGQLSTEEYVEVSEGRELPRENGWSVNDPAPRLERLGSDQAGSMKSNDEQKSDKLSAARLLPEKLTPSEIEALRQDARDGIAHARMAFSKPSVAAAAASEGSGRPAEQPRHPVMSTPAEIESLRPRRERADRLRAKGV